MREATTMRYLIQENTKSLRFSRRKQFTIRDANKRDAFRAVDKKGFKGLSLQLPDGCEVATVGLREDSEPKVFEVFCCDKLIAVVQLKNFVVRSTVATVFAASAGGFLEVRRSMAGYKLTFIRDSTTLAIVSRKKISVSNTFELEVSDTEDDVLILSCIIALIGFGNGLI